MVPGFPAVDIKISGRYLAPIPYQERRVVSTWASCGDPVGGTSLLSAVEIIFSSRYLALKLGEDRLKNLVKPWLIP